MMKKYFLYAFFILFALVSCEDDETLVDGEDETIDYGDVKAKFEAKTFDGTVVTTVTMGESVSFFDISDGRPDIRNWTLPGAEPQSSDRLMSTVLYPIPGKYSVTLQVERSSDGQTDEASISEYIEVLSIPVEAVFSPSVPEENGVVNIKTGDMITYTDASTGLPELWAWEFGGGTPATSSEQSPTIQYLEPGMFDVKFKATRDDAGNLVESEVMKTAYINVVQRVVDYERIVATDNKIVVTYTEKMAQDIPAGAASEFAVTIKTAAGATISSSVTAIQALDDYNVELTFDNQMYSDDELFLSFTSGGMLKDATGLYTPVELMDKPGSYGHNLFDIGIYTFESDHDKWVSIDVGTAEVSDEKSYSGNYSLKIEGAQGDQWVAAEAMGDGVKTMLEPGTAYTLSWKIWRDPSSTGNVLGPWLKWDLAAGGTAQKQFWTGLNTLAYGEWVTVTKEYVYAGEGSTWFWLRTKDKNLFYIDDISIVIPNPRP